MVSTEFQIGQPEELVKTSCFSLFRVDNKQTGETYLLKQFKTAFPTRLQNLKSIIELAKEQNWHGALIPIETKQIKKVDSILFVNFPGICLRKLIEKREVRPGNFPLIAASLVKTVSGFHNKGWIIRNLCPEHILINPKTYECKIIDLQKVTTLKCKKLARIGEDDQISTYAYVSPEQTGYTHHLVDHRADYYALGIIFYELLSGRHPFPFQEARKLIQAQLSVNPSPLNHIDAIIPERFNDIILKLLSKLPNDRYQSEKGLLYDVEKPGEMQVSGNGKSWQAGSHDHVKSIHFSGNLIGRKKELDVLSNYQELSKKGNKQIVYIRGNSGVGKTRLMEEFTFNRSIFKETTISAKFDILQRNTPYSAFIHALKQLIIQLFKEEASELETWRQRILAFLKGNGVIICEVIPELSIIIGTQSPVADLPPDESQKRFNQTFLSFIRCFTSEKHSLTIFLDDLQWADIASIKFIESLVFDNAVHNLLFIGAYRNKDITQTHPLSLSLKKQESWIDIKELKLEPLQLIDTKELIMQSLYRPVAHADAFVVYMHAKTKGNVFFIIQLLSALFNERLLTLSKENTWQWNESVLNAYEYSSNVLDLLVHNISALETPLNKILLYTASLGASFDLKTTAYLLNYKLTYLAKELAKAVNLGYIIPQDEHLDKYLNTTSSIPDEDLVVFGNPTFRFSHDRIRVAALSFAQENELAEINLKAVRYKMAHYSPKEKADQLFFLANHFNEGEKLIADNGEMQELISINYLAGLKAKNASAYDSAINFFSCGAKHLNTTDHQKQVYNFYLEMGICKFLSGRYTEAEEDINIAFNNAKTRLEKLETLFPRAYLYIVQDQKQHAVNLAGEGYGLYGIRMPRTNTAIKFSLLRDVLLLKMRINGHKIHTLINKEAMQDKESIRFLEFTLAIAPAIYQTNQNLFAWNVMRMVFRTLNHGTNGIASIAYLGYGMILSQLFKDYKSGKDFADLALLINNTFGYTTLKWKVLLSYYNFVHHWTVPIRPELDKILEVENGAFANGDPIFAGYAIFVYHQKKFALGFNLSALQESFEQYLRLAEERQDIETRNFLLSYYYAIRCLRGQETDLLSLGGQFDVANKLKESIESSSYSIAADTFIAHMTVLFIFNYTEEALEQYLCGCKYMEFIQQRYEYEEFNFYGALICASAIRKKIGNRKTLIKKLRQHVSLFKTWSNNCPENFKAQYLLIIAEVGSCIKNTIATVNVYEQAIRQAEDCLCVHYKAMACELAGRYHLQFGNVSIVKHYFELAIKSYITWGATGKAKILENEFEELFGHRVAVSKEYEISHSSLLTKKLNAIFDHSTIKSPKDIDELLENAINLMVENVISDTAYLLLKLRSSLVIKAEYTGHQPVKSVTEYLEGDKLPLALIKYVERLKEPLILNDPFSIPEYNPMSYFQKKKPLSVLVYPIIREDEIFGILYLENYASQGVFEYEKLDTVNIIATRLAVILSYHQRYYKIFQEKEQLKATYEKALLQSQVEIQEQAFTKISQEIHDNIGQVLSLVRLNINTLETESNAEKIAISDELLGHAIADLRHLSHSLNNDYIRKAGLTEAIRELLMNLKRTGKYNTCFNDKAELIKFTSEKSIIIYRIIQEIVNNIVRHADATNISITMLKEEERTRITITDNGKGFDTTNFSKGVGIISMTERAALIDAALEIESKLNEGTTVNISFNTL